LVDVIRGDLNVEQCHTYRESRRRPRAQVHAVGRSHGQGPFCRQPPLAGQDGEWQEQTSFFTGTVWREQAETVAESLQKGTRVIVSGRLEQRSWETDEGDKRSVVEVQIDEIGPSLRWATATVNKTQRSDGDFGGGGGGNKSVPPAPVARDDYGPDEAPF
jgi:single-strand DNA-binding protein